MDTKTHEASHLNGALEQDSQNLFGTITWYDHFQATDI